MSWSKPLLEGFQVLDDIDVWVIQIAEKPVVTNEDPLERTYTFVKLDRETSDDDLRKQVVRRKCPGYMTLWKKSQEAWKTLGEAIYESKGHDVDELLAIATKYCKEFLELRKGFRENLDLKMRSQCDLYKDACQVFRLFMDYRSQLAYVMLHPDVDVCDALWETHKGMDGYNPVQAPEDLDIVICTVGAVSPEALEHRSPGEIQKLVDQLYWTPEHPKPEPWTKEWLDAASSQMISYGHYANLEEECFLHEDDAIGWAREHLGGLGCTLGFALDRPANRLGSTGWDFLCGDVLGGLKRPPLKGREKEHALARKISGLEEQPKEPES